MELFLTMRKRAEFPNNMSYTPEDMPMDVVLRALDIVAESKSPQVLFKGNEAFLHPELEMILKGCQKRGVIPVFETSGLMPSMAKKMVLEQSIRMIWRLYRPKFYSEADFAEMRENLDAFMKAGCIVRLSIMVDDPDADYEFVREYLDTYKFDSVTFWVSCLTPQEKIAHAMEFYTNLSRDYLKKKVRPLLSCGIMPCAMTDAQFGLLAKIGHQFGRCTPHLGVLPDGRVCHCEEMAMLPGPNLSMFRTERELQKFYYDVFRELQWTMDVCPECKQCICMTGGSCTGLSMAQMSGGDSPPASGKSERALLSGRLLLGDWPSVGRRRRVPQMRACFGESAHRVGRTAPSSCPERQHHPREAAAGRNRKRGHQVPAETAGGRTAEGLVVSG